MLRFLLLEDNAIDAQLLQRMLKSSELNPEIVWVKTRADFLEALTASEIDLILADYTLPGFDGMEALQLVKQYYPEIPFILVSGNLGEELAIEALKQGATDYILKQRLGRLLPCVQRGLREAQERRDLQRTEAALRQSEAQLRLATEGANLGMWYWDAADNSLTWTNQAKAMFGLAPDTEMSMSVFLNAVHPDDRAFVLSIVSELQDGQEHTEIEYRTLWADGTVRWILAKGDCLYSADARLLATRGVLMDITKQKQIEADRQQLTQQLTQRVNELQTLFDLLPIGVAIAKDPTCKTIHTNRSMSNLIRVSIEQNASHSAPSEQRPAYRLCREEQEIPIENLPMQRAAVHQTEVKDEVIDLVHPDGTLIKLLCYASPLLTEQGEARGALGAFVDITERISTETALRESQERLSLAIDNAGMATWDIDMRTGKGIWSASHFTMLGYDSIPNGEATYDLWFSCVHPDDQPSVLQAIEEAQQHKSLYRPEYRIVRANTGEVRWLNAFGRFLYDEFDQPTRFIGVLFDASDRKFAELEREAAREEAERANRIKDEFLAVLSHELRSPLNPILGWAKILKSGRLNSDKATQAIATIERNAQLQSELIEDLLDVSRILQGKLRLNVRPTNLVSTITGAIETVRLAAEAKSITLETHFAEVGQVAGDATRLQQLVWNLLSNAVKFTPERGQVTVRLEAIDKQAQITVSDTGKGIDPSFLPHVFEYFRQEDGAITRKFGGLGLGLAIVRHLVELHGGTVIATSEGENRGATFTVKLPMMATASIDDHHSNQPDRRMNLNGIQALVVDDEPDSRDFTAFVLEQAGAQVKTTASAGEAFAVLMRSRFDILISDIGMPDMDGYMLMQQVRALPVEHNQQIRAIALTAYAGDFNYQQAIKAGFQQHVAKPIDPELLVSTIAGLCNH